MSALGQTTWRRRTYEHRHWCKLWDKPPAFQSSLGTIHKSADSFIVALSDGSEDQISIIGADPVTDDQRERISRDLVGLTVDDGARVAMSSATGNMNDEAEWARRIRPRERDELRVSMSDKETIYAGTSNIPGGNGGAGYPVPAVAAFESLADRITKFDNAPDAITGLLRMTIGNASTALGTMVLGLGRDGVAILVGTDVPASIFGTDKDAIETDRIGTEADVMGWKHERTVVPTEQAALAFGDLSLWLRSSAEKVIAGDRPQTFRQWAEQNSIDYENRPAPSVVIR